MFPLSLLLLLLPCFLYSLARIISLHSHGHPDTYLTDFTKLISQLLKRLRDKLAGGTRRDPFTALPLEIAHLTLGLFTFKQIACVNFILRLECS
jgi:hypothetical protein